MRVAAREKTWDKQDRSKCSCIDWHLIMPRNEISLPLILIASSSAGDKKETWIFYEERGDAENQGKAWALLGADGTWQFCLCWVITVSLTSDSLRQVLCLWHLWKSTRNRQVEDDPAPSYISFFLCPEVQELPFMHLLPSESSYSSTSAVFLVGWFIHELHEMVPLCISA